MRKEALISALVLVMPDLQKPFVVQADASGGCIGGNLLQEGHAIAYESRRLCDAELHYDIYEKDGWQLYML